MTLGVTDIAIVKFNLHRDGYNAHRCTQGFSPFPISTSRIVFRRPRKGKSTLNHVIKYLNRISDPTFKSEISYGKGLLKRSQTHTDTHTS